MTGVVLPFWLDRRPSEAVEIATNADQLGFEELWMGELYHFDSFALAGNLAARTAAITPVIGPVAAGVRDATSIARAFSSVAQLAGRPVRLALGASNPTVVGRFHGRPFGGEAGRMRSVAGAVRTQVETGVSPSGYRSALPPTPLHLTVAAFGPRMVAVAAEVADRMVVNLVTSAQAKELAVMAGIPTVAWVVAALEPGQATRRQVSSQIAHYLAAPGYADMFRDAGFDALVDEALARRPIAELADSIPEELLGQVTMYGSAREIGTALEHYRNSGVDVAAVPATADDPAGERVLQVLAGVG